jgi:hypothetical protein
MIKSRLDDVDSSRNRSAELSYGEYTEVNGGKKFATPGARY